MMHHNHRSNYATGDDDDDRAPLMGARQRRLTGDVPYQYRDDPVSKVLGAGVLQSTVGLGTGKDCYDILVCMGCTMYYDYR